MTDQSKWDIRITLTLVIFAFTAMILSFGCEKKCPKGEVRVKDKFYVPGVAYLRANGQERMV